LEATPTNGESVTVCVFLITDWRTGRWDVTLPADGFTISTGIQWYPEPTGAMRSYCKTVSIGSHTPSPVPNSPSSAPISAPTMPTKAPTLAPTKTPTMAPTMTPTKAPTKAPSPTTHSLSYAFPPVTTSQFVHGLCVLGASQARATSNDPQLTYTEIPNFADDVELWGNRGYKALGVDNDGDCVGGTYLQPSLHKSVDLNTEIALEATPTNGESVTVCAFVVTDWRTGQWDVTLPAEGFTMSTGIQWYPEPTGAMRSYCKILQ